MIIVFTIVYLDNCTNGQKVSLIISHGSKVQYRFVTFSTGSIKISPFITIFVRYVCYMHLVSHLIPCFHYTSTQYCNRDVKIEAPLCNSVIATGVFISDVSFSVSQCDDSEDEDFDNVFVQASFCQPQVKSFLEFSFFSQLDFSLVLRYFNPPSCWSLNNNNEGVLVTALFGDGSTLPLQYFTTTGGNITLNKPHVNITQINSSHCQLRLQNTSYIIPVSRTNERGPVPHTINISDYRLFAGNISFSWTQYHHGSAGKQCDVWSLDNVRVFIDTNGSSSIVYSEDFDSGTACETLWSCTLAQISQNSYKCGNDDEPCLFFTGGLTKDRIAVSPIINEDLSAFYDQSVTLHEAVTLPLLSCNGHM